MKKTKKKKKSNNRITAVIIALLIIIIIVLLLIKACDATQPGGTGTGNRPTIDDPFGTFEVVDTKQQKVTEESVGFDPNATITFAGYGKFRVTDKNPKVELSNPEINTVDMVFTLMDNKTGEVIARTGKVAPGKFVYIDVVKYYKEKGTYRINIVTDTYHVDSGAQMNGMNQEMEVVYS